MPTPGEEDQIGRQLPLEEEHELVRKVREGDLEAERRLMLSMIRYVEVKAQDRAEPSVPAEDLVQAGTIGCLIAMRRHDPTRGARLLTHARQWIRSEMRDCLHRNRRVVRLSTSGEIVQLSSHVRQMLREGGRISEEDVAGLAKRFEVRERMVRLVVEHVTGGDVAFHALDDSEDGTAPENVLPAPGADPAGLVEERDHREKLRGSIDRSLSAMDGRAQDIVASRWLREDGGKETHVEIAKRLGFSRPTIKRSERRALDTLRDDLSQDAAFAPDAPPARKPKRSPGMDP